MKILKSRYAPLILPVLQLLFTVVVYQSLPDDLPMQFSLSGETNWTLPKIYGAWLFPMFTSFVAIYNIYFKPDISKGSIWFYTGMIFVFSVGLTVFILMM